MERQVPYLFSIVPDPAVPEAQKVQGWGGPDKPVDTWLALGPRQQVTLPPRIDAELTTRCTMHVEDPNLPPPTGFTAEFEGQDRLVCHDRRRNVSYVFDFGFRAPQALGRVVKGKNKTTMEI
jgi:hypothetical protein